MQATGSVANPVKTGTPRPTPAILILALVLALQLGLALLLSLGRANLTASPETPLLGFERSAVDHLRIEHTGADPLTLEHHDGRWVIANLDGFPAAENKVEGLLKRLAGLQKRLPVATSAEGQARFKVAGDDFEGRIVLKQGDETLATLYLGDAAGFRRRYVRAGDDPAVFEADLGPAETTARPDDWIDRAWLHQDLRDIQRIELPEVRLARPDEGDGWQLVDAGDGEQLDQEAAKDLASQLALLTFNRVLGTEAKPEYQQDAPLVEWQLTLASGDTVGYRLSQLAEPPAESTKPGDSEADEAETPARYILKLTDKPYYLELPAYAAERLIGATRASLLVPPPAPAGETATPADEPAADDDRSATGADSTRDAAPGPEAASAAQTTAPPEAKPTTEDAPLAEPAAPVGDDTP